MVDLSDAEYVETNQNLEQTSVLLKILNENDRNTIFNVIIMENDEESVNGK